MVLNNCKRSVPSGRGMGPHGVPSGVSADGEGPRALHPYGHHERTTITDLISIVVALEWGESCRNPNLWLHRDPHRTNIWA